MQATVERALSRLDQWHACTDLNAVCAAMASLPAEHRELMALVVIGGQTYEETADIPEIPIGTVMSRITRARCAIAQHVSRCPWEANA